MLCLMSPAKGQSRAALHPPIHLMCCRSLLFLPEEKNDSDTFLLHRTYPFDLIQSVITPHAAERRFADGRLATSNAAVDGGFGRGSALLANKDLKALAETAMALERMLGVPIALHWECLADGTYRITRLFPLQLVQKEISGDELAKEQENAEIICEGGQLVQSGCGRRQRCPCDRCNVARRFPGRGGGRCPGRVPTVDPDIAAGRSSSDGIRQRHRPSCHRGQGITSARHLRHCRTF